MKLKRDPEEKNEFTEPRTQGREINQEPEDISFKEAKAESRY